MKKENFINSKLIFLFVIAILGITCCSNKEKEARNAYVLPSPWPMFLQNPTRTGQAVFAGPKRPKILWEYHIPKGLIEASVIIGKDSNIYVGSWNGCLYALSPKGSLLWKFCTQDAIRGAVAIGKDGSIYLASKDGCLYALTPWGELKWKFATKGKISSSPLIDGNGTIYITLHDRFLYALNTEGNLKWNLEIGYMSASSPALSRDGGTLYLASYNGFLYAVSVEGKILWKRKMGHLALLPALVDMQFI